MRTLSRPAESNVHQQPSTLHPLLACRPESASLRSAAVAANRPRCSSASSTACWTRCGAMVMHHRGSGDASERQWRVLLCCTPKQGAAASSDAASSATCPTPAPPPTPAGGPLPCSRSPAPQPQPAPPECHSLLPPRQIPAPRAAAAARTARAARLAPRHPTAAAGAAKPGSLRGCHAALRTRRQPGRRIPAPACRAPLGPRLLQRPLPLQGPPPAASWPAAAPPAPAAPCPQSETASCGRE